MATHRGAIVAAQTWAMYESWVSRGGNHESGDNRDQGGNYTKLEIASVKDLYVDMWQNQQEVAAGGTNSSWCVAET